MLIFPGMFRLLTESGEPFSKCLVGCLIISVPMLFLAVVFPGSFGGGDIKLVAAGGFFLGADLIVEAALIALFSAGAYCLWKYVVKRCNRKERFALGPFLCAGMMLASL